MNQNQVQCKCLNNPLSCPVHVEMAVFNQKHPHIISYCQLSCSIASWHLCGNLHLVKRSIWCGLNVLAERMPFCHRSSVPSVSGFSFFSLMCRSWGNIRPQFWLERLSQMYMQGHPQTGTFSRYSHAKCQVVPVSIHNKMADERLVQCYLGLRNGEFSTSNKELNGYETFYVVLMALTLQI